MRGGSVVASSTHTATESTGGTQAVDRAAALLTLVIEAETPLAFADLVADLGLARSTTSRLLAALERTRLLERLDTGEYVGGPLFALYAARHDRSAEMARLAMPMLQQLGEATGETVHLAVPSGDRVMHVGQVDSTFLLGARDWTDVEVPTHCSALGKVLLAWGPLPLPEDRLETPTEHSLRSRSALDDDLAKARAHGFAVAHDELEIGLLAVAAPVCGPEGAAVAAVGVSGPTARLEDRVDHVGRLLMEQAQSLSELLRRGSRATSPQAGPERETA